MALRVVSIPRSESSTVTSLPPREVFPNFTYKNTMTMICHKTLLKIHQSILHVMVYVQASVQPRGALQIRASLSYRRPYQCEVL